MKGTGGMKVVLLMCLGVFVCMLDSTIMNITLPAIQDSLHTTLETSSWMLNVYTMTIAVLAIPMARFAEMFGRNKFYIAGLFVFGLGSAFCGLAGSGDFLIAARFIQSFGAAILIPCSMVIGIAAMPIEKRVLPLTLLGATQGLATALGPTVGGIVTEKLSWHWVFYVNVPICLLAIVAAFFILTLKKEGRIKSKIDWFGLLFSISAIFPLNLVLVKGNTWGWDSAQAIICYLATAFSIALFIMVEKKSKAPMVNLNLFKDRLFTGSVLTVTTGFIFLIGVMVLLPQFLTNFQHKTELQAALLVTPVSAAIFVFSNFAGLLSKKIGYTIPVIIGFGIMGIAYYLLHNLNIHSTSKEIILLCSLLGLGFSFVISSATIASTSSFEGEMLTASQSVFSMLRQVGVVLAVAIFVAGLTNNIQDKKQDVTHFAAQRLENLAVLESAKEKILRETKKSIYAENKDLRTKPTLITNTERQQIIDKNVQSALASIPEEQRSQVKEQIYQKVEKQVDDDIDKNKKLVKNYGNQVTDYALKTISSSFAELYKSSIPFVLLSCLTGIVFWERKKKSAASFLNTTATSE
ncbi:drug resistance transporter, EmrB/QacA subfamily protein [Neobacillus bataviensis LMG 21833]|uniref:Drug resistance transporter, EmrB/QacA subfamily protein n=1 Tax=Neobacillus bataviensis LMG 21833 TaxID=1117379 RepID=K6DCU5_9BACI|nr:MFS transporter [Neobacillus bataviensis]EKN66114.1 drug resistance transporter, EmrB/QacA subfamily protein [Neobacillus bataviensis LMG 21833]